MRPKWVVLVLEQDADLLAEVCAVIEVRAGGREQRARAVPVCDPGALLEVLDAQTNVRAVVAGADSPELAEARCRWMVPTVVADLQRGGRVALLEGLNAACRRKSGPRAKVSRKPLPAVRAA